MPPLSFLFLFVSFFACAVLSLSSPNTHVIPQTRPSPPSVSLPSPIYQMRRMPRVLIRSNLANVYPNYDGLDPLGFLTVPATPTIADQPTADGTAPSIPTINTMPKNAAKHSFASAGTVVSYSVIGTPPPLPIMTPTTSSQSSNPTETAFTAPSSPSTPSNFPSSSAADKAALSEWKIIGVAVIAFTAVAIVILGVVFFDQWWTDFLRPILWKHKRSAGVEVLIPDWDKRSWRIGIEERGDRYPSIASFPSAFKLNSSTHADENDCLPVPPFLPRAVPDATSDPRNPAELLPPNLTSAAAWCSLPPNVRTSVSASVPNFLKPPGSAFGRNSPELCDEYAYDGAEERCGANASPPRHPHSYAC